MDNENDFLVKVTEGLVELKQFCKTPTEVAILINPLQILASLDQPAVRDQAIVSFKKLCAGEGKGTDVAT